jgi:hypothetical protein
LKRVRRPDARRDGANGHDCVCGHKTEHCVPDA